MKKQLFALVLALALALSLCACNATLVNNAPEAPAVETPTVPADGSVLGEGAHSFAFEVRLKDGTAYNYTVNTDAETLGEALVELELIAGEESEYGLYVTTVLGETLDYAADGYWWCLYEGDAMAEVGVDSATVADGASYAFVAVPAEG